ncbi:hypothetical protein Ndes2437A_g04813 [Nannochloris sp. 'desiccata']|nr:hypothetical protein KSW81_002865 [Chlorella desiccata (nom. nud.)]
MGDEFKDQFRAAKAARTTVKHSKEQLKALKAQKAAAAAQQQAAKVAAGRDEDTKSMPPPPPRPASQPPPTAPLQKPSTAAGPGSYHQDSQGTRINDGGGVTTASILQSEPSVNKQTAAQLNHNNNNNNTSLVDSNAPLPTGFFEAVAAAQGGQGSTGGGLSVDRVVSKAAKSGEGSTGASLGGDGGGREEMRSGGGAGDFLIATSQLSAMVETELNQVAPAVSHALGGGTSQQKKNTGNISVEGDGGGGGGTSSRQRQQLPTGFFETVSAGPQGTKASVAAGVGTKDLDMDKEFADFMKEVDVDATETEAAAGAGAVEEEEEDEESARRARDDFEQFVRMERLREVKEATKTAAATNGTTQFETAVEETPASALEIAGVVADDVVPPPKLVLPRKRKVSEMVAILEKEGSDDDSGDEEDGAGMVDWRAKKSVKK